MSTPPILQAADAAISGITATLTNIEQAVGTLNRLESMVTLSRAERVPDVKVTSVEVTTAELPGNIGIVNFVVANTGDTGQYKTRITLAPKPGFRCTCPDMTKRRAPCKHVGALAVTCRKRLWAMSDNLMADLESHKKERDELAALFLSVPLLTRNLTTKAEDSVKNALNAAKK